MARKRAPGKKPPSPKMRSGFEGKISLALDAAGVGYEYECERIPYIVPETKRAYIPDFTCLLKNGKHLRIEGKGLFDPTARKKMILVIEQNPHLDIRILLQRDNYLRKGSKTRYSDWCRKHNIPFAVSATGTPPREWLE